MDPRSIVFPEWYATPLAICREWLEPRLVTPPPEQGQPDTEPSVRYFADGVCLSPHIALADNAATHGGKRAIAVLPLHGPITQRKTLFSRLFGGTSTTEFARRFDEMMASQHVGTIVIDADTPGGSVSGVPELADKVFKGCNQKRIVMVCNSMLGSAGYWIGASASEVVVTPSGTIGSIGVWILHVDTSEANKKAGLDVTMISAGKYKTEMNPFEPISEEAKAYEQSEINRYYDQFVAAVARGRGVSASTVRNGFGQGRMVGPQVAVDEGMADSVATLEQVVRREAGAKTTAQAEHDQRVRYINRMERELEIGNN